jgi:hypothetical protein
MELAIKTKCIRVEVEPRLGHLFFQVTGSYDFQDFRLLIHGLFDECVRIGDMAALIDISSLEGDIPGFERFELGVLFSQVWGMKLKAGITAPKDRINRFFENTAVNRGARVFVDHDAKRVLEWLILP